jgi:hypothetical protein
MQEAPIFYKDADGKSHGPFTAQKVVAWYMAGYLHEQVPVKYSDTEYVPLAVILGTLQRLLDSTLTSWPEVHLSLRTCHFVRIWSCSYAGDTRCGILGRPRGSFTAVLLLEL